VRDKPGSRRDKWTDTVSNHPPCQAAGCRADSFVTAPQRFVIIVNPCMMHMFLPKPRGCTPNRSRVYRCSSVLSVVQATLN
jgi:hypothetical protein